MNKLVTILMFSSRKNGNCASIGEFILNYFDSNIRIFRVSGENVGSCDHCDYECLKSDMCCPNLNESYRSMMDTVCASDLVYFIIPNYCGFPSSSYFAFNERSVGYFGLDRSKLERYMAVRKRFIIVSNSVGFEDAMRQQTSGEPEILYLKCRKYNKRSIAGDILESEEAQQDLEAFLAADRL